MEIKLEIGLNLLGNLKLYKFNSYFSCEGKYMLSSNKTVSYNHLTLPTNSLF
ncbi:hypothetical protein JSCD4_36250 [Clostridioides difficile]|nr:hypothetical protein JSCD4_36250 [Clostridioides difficile]